MRFGRLPVPVINDRPDYTFEVVAWARFAGEPTYFAATGLMVGTVLEVVEEFARAG